MNSAREYLAQIAHSAESQYPGTKLAAGHAHVTRRVRRHRTARTAATTVAGIGVIGGATWGGMSVFARGDALAPGATTAATATASTAAAQTLNGTALGPCDDALAQLGNPASATYPNGEVPNNVLCTITNGDGVAVMLSRDGATALPLILRGDAAIGLAGALDAIAGAGLQDPCFSTGYMTLADQQSANEASGNTMSAEAAAAHGAGLAFDLCASAGASYDDVARVASTFGWTVPNPATPWHFEYRTDHATSATRVAHKITVPGGKTLDWVAAKLGDAYGIRADDAKAVIEAAVHTQIPSASTPEGWPMPGTYDLADAPTPSHAADLMVSARVQELTDLGVPRADWQTVITKASLVEREAKLDEDRPKVARVIENRLAQGEMLQLDSTILYAGAGDGPFVSAEDRDVDSPYNTYLYEGLPPGAIATPSDASIQAVLAPAEGDWLYFVTVNLETGETLFATTYEDHLANVERLREWVAAQE